MNLEEYCGALSDEQKLNLAVRLIKAAMPVWDNFALKKKLSYRDSVVWLKHEIDKNFLNDVILEIENSVLKNDSVLNLKANKKLLKYYGEFTEPVTAIQDDDWKLPYAPGKIFYSVYNLLCAVMAEENASSLYFLAINQAIDAIDKEKTISEEEIISILTQVR